MNDKTEMITAQEWAQIPYWKRKYIYFSLRLYVFRNDLKRFFKMLWLDDASSEALRKAMKISAHDWGLLTQWDRREIAFLIFLYFFKNKIKRFFKTLVM